MQEYSGSCHCGAIRFTVICVPDETTSCNCTLCRKKNALMIQVPKEALRITAGIDKLATYQWNTRVAQHHFCTLCGIYTFHRKRSNPESYGVNVYCLEGFDPDSVPHRLADGIAMSVVA